MKILTNSAQLIADYLAGKIEQSSPIQSLFQELLLLFEQEAICIGPAFRNTAASSLQETDVFPAKGGSKGSNKKGPNAFSHNADDATGNQEAKPE